MSDRQHDTNMDGGIGVLYRLFISLTCTTPSCPPAAAASRAAPLLAVPAMPWSYYMPIHNQDDSTQTDQHTMALTVSGA